MKTISKEEFFSPVRSVETSSIISLENFDIRDDKTQAIIVTKPDGSEKIVNFCSPVYKLNSTTECFQMLEAHMKDKMDFEVVYSHEHFQRFYADYKILGRETSIGSLQFVEDKVIPQIRVSHSYDGKVSFTFSVGLWRQVCSNGLMGYRFDQKVRKNTTNSMETITEMMAKEMAEVLESIEKLKVKYEVLADRKVENWTDRILEVVNQKEIYFPVKQVDEVISRVKLEHQDYELPITDWLIYNAFNYQLNHNTAIGLDENSKTILDQRIFQFLEN